MLEKLCTTHIQIPRGSKVLVLEDDLARQCEFSRNLIGCQVTITHSAQCCIEHLELPGNYDLIFLDHDLGERVFDDSRDVNTGCEVARYLEKHPTDAKIIIHSLNPIGAACMQAYLPKARRIPFAWNSIKVSNLEP